ncbi:MAG: caspase family protein, partial [Myxococcaceae bacterium]|nr:caspase family protein [Myxococcaceae bacterium]
MLGFILALAAAATPAGDTSFAIVVGNNQSPVLGRRSLQYADDDAVKYAEVFRASLAPENLRLLTTADDDTARLFPETLTRAVKPTREVLKQSFQEMVTAIRQGKQAGHHTRAWFIFAGHGDVDRGRGFIELADGAFTGDDLVAALKEVDADEMHVILDSCNSYFVLAPRKPGGRHFATPADAALELSQRLPKVGVLLSTSAEAEVYEWSAFQSGIFSHAVRSALTGAADVNGDG